MIGNRKTWADRMYATWDMDNRDGYTRLHEDFGIPYEAMDYDYNDHILHIKENAVKGIDKDAVRWEVPLAIKIVWE